MTTATTEDQRQVASDALRAWAVRQPDTALWWAITVECGHPAPWPYIRPGTVRCPCCGEEGPGGMILPRGRRVPVTLDQEHLALEVFCSMVQKTTEPDGRVRWHAVVRGLQRVGRAPTLAGAVLACVDPEPDDLQL